jgi:FAD/FMN-containing dehydrogenase
MHQVPTNVSELTQLLAENHARGSRIPTLDLSALNQVLEHKAEDMTASVQTGITLQNFQQQLSLHGQWLPLDPPAAEKLTLKAMLESNASGPRRFGYGTIRDYVIGMTVALADGRLIHSGGKVVKNVAGYDLMKLFVGSYGSLGIIVEVTFKVLPLPESEQFVEKRCQSLDDAENILEAIFDSELAPKVLDLHRLSPNEKSFCLVIGFAGSRAEVEWQLSLAQKLGFDQPSSLEYNQKYFSSASSVQKRSVLPSKLVATLKGLNDYAFVARAGNGVIFHSGSLPADNEKRATNLEQRLKNAFDPKLAFPAYEHDIVSLKSLTS